MIKVTILADNGFNSCSYTIRCSSVEREANYIKNHAIKEGYHGKVQILDIDTGGLLNFEV